MKKRKMLLFAICFVMMVGLLSGCGPKQPEDNGSGEPQTNNQVEDGYLKPNGEKIKVGFSVGTTKEERWVKEIELARKFAEEHGIELIAQSADDDANKQMTQIESMVNQGVDVILISAKDSESAGAASKIANEAGVKVISYERGVNNGPVDYYVAFDAVQVGEVQAQMLVEKHPKGNYIYLHGGPEDALVPMYIEGNEKILRPYIDKGDINIVSEQYCIGWNPDEAMKHTENALAKVQNDVVAVLAPNDSTAGGVIQALRAQGLEGKVGVSGQDGDLAAVQRIVEGTQTGTAFKYLPALNETAMQMAVDLALGKTEEVDAKVTGTTDNGYADIPTVHVPVIHVNKDNIDAVIIGTGFHPLEKVYANIPKDQWPEVEVTGTLDFGKYVK